MLHFYCHICGKAFEKGQETKSTILGNVHATCLKKQQNEFITKCVGVYNEICFKQRDTKK